MTNKTQTENEHVAVAKALNASISTKHSVEIGSAIRNKNIVAVKSFLEGVIKLKVAVPFKRYNRDVGHKKGKIAAGRFPQNAAREFLKLVKSAEANAQVKGLDTSNLKIVKVVSNIASIPFSGGRRRRGTKRTHIEMIVKEGEISKKVSSKGKTPNKEIKSEEKTKTSVEKVSAVEKKETNNQKVAEVKEVEVKEKVVTIQEVKQKTKIQDDNIQESKSETPEVKQ